MSSQTGLKASTETSQLARAVAVTHLCGPLPGEISPRCRTAERQSTRADVLQLLLRQKIAEGERCALLPLPSSMRKHHEAGVL